MFSTEAATPKGRAIRRDGRVALCVDDERAAVRLGDDRRHATGDERPYELQRWATRIGGRYMVRSARRSSAAVTACRASMSYASCQANSSAMAK